MRETFHSKIRGHFGLTGYWLNFWVMVSCSTAMLLFGYDQGVFGELAGTSSKIWPPPRDNTISRPKQS